MKTDWQRLRQIAADSRGPRDGDQFDVIIVGAGLAGLRAAYELRARKPLVLEREPRAGGRVLTRNQHGVAYDLGAVFAFDHRALPFELELDLMIEPSQLGIAVNGAAHFGADVFECCAKLGLDADEWAALARFGADVYADAARLPPRVYAALNAFFQIIHPGELRDYAPLRQHDALQTLACSHYVAGNGALVAALAQHAELGARLRVNAAVQSIEDLGERVRVVYRERDETRSIFARAVIVTPPAPLVRELVTPMNADAREYLEQLCYEPGIVIALGVRGVTLPEFGCLVTPAADLSTILQQHTLVPDLSVLLVYYAGVKARRVWEWDDATLARETLAAVKSLALGDWNASELVFTEAQRWAHVGPVMSKDTIRAWNERALALTPRVFLGGEAAAMSHQDPLPYGMSAALAGGRHAALEARRVLELDSRAARFGQQLLVDATVYQLTEHAPRFVERLREGNIAFYGLVAQATRDEALVKYLLEQAQNGLWEYQNGFGVTAEDSALVLEGLLECGAAGERLRYSAQRLVEQFYDAEAGAFHTLYGGRARYWRGASVDASAHIGYLLARIDPDTYASHIAACAAFVAAAQQPDGLWQGRWFPSRMITTFYAARLLARFDYADALGRAYHAILTRQTRRGSWDNSVVETAAAMLALRVLAALNASAWDAIERGRQWLVSQKDEHGWRGEPLLYYWYELDDGTRLFYHCADRGQVTGAWATLALR